VTILHDEFSLDSYRRISMNVAGISHTKLYHDREVLWQGER